MDELEKIFDKAKKIKLTSLEKEKMRSFITSVIKKRQAGAIELIYFTFPFKRPVLVLLALFLIIASGAGISFAAERALPGDILYPVKIKVNEEIRGLISITDEKKVQWLTEVAERRIEETETLAKQDRLDQETQEAIEKNFEKRAEKIREKLETIDEKNNLDAAERVSQNLEDTLEKHREILERLSEEKAEAKEEIDSALENVKSLRDSVRKSREGFEERKRSRKARTD